MANSYFQFKQFKIERDKCAMKVCTDSCLFGAWVPIPTSTKTILDIGTGTGLLSLMCAQKTNASITGIEIDEAAYLQTQSNFKNSHWNNRLEVVLGDIRKYAFQQKFDFIICNPPFFKDKIVSFSPTEKIAKHSTHLNIYELFESIHNLLNLNGQFACLFPFFRKDEIEKIAYEFNFHLVHSIYFKQSTSHSYFRYAAVFTTQKNEPLSHQEVAIKNELGHYSDAVIQLLQPYYLYL